MVSVLHAGGVFGWAATLEEDKGQGADQALGGNAMNSIFLPIGKGL